MENNITPDILKINASFDTPEVDFDATTGILKIIGNSYPEDPVQFYSPVVEWLKIYSQKPVEKTTMFLQFKYFNTPSTQIFLEIFKILETIYEQGYIVSVEWVYEIENEELKENGETYSTLYNIPFKMTAIEYD